MSPTLRGSRSELVKQVFKLRCKLSSCATSSAVISRTLERSLFVDLVPVVNSSGNVKCTGDMSNCPIVARLLACAVVLGSTHHRHAHTLPRPLTVMFFAFLL